MPKSLLEKQRTKAYKTLLDKDMRDDMLWKGVDAHSKPYDLVRAFIKLKEKKILTVAHARSLIFHNDPENLSYAMVILNEKKLLSPKNRWHMFFTRETFNLSIVLKLLLQADLLNQENFNLVTALEHNYLLSSVMVEILWARLAPHQIRFYWPTLVESLKEPRPVRVLEHLTQRILDKKDLDSELKTYMQEKAEQRIFEVANQYALMYLSELVIDDRTKPLCRTLIAQLKETGMLAPLWPMIAERVAFDLWPEFHDGGLYREFQLLISEEIPCCLGYLESIELKLYEWKSLAHDGFFSDSDTEEQQISENEDVCGKTLKR